MLIILDIVFLLLEFISKEKKRCTERFMPNTALIKNDKCLLCSTQAGYSGEQNRHRPCAQGAYS